MALYSPTVDPRVLAQLQLQGNVPIAGAGLNPTTIAAAQPGLSPAGRLAASPVSQYAQTPGAVPAAPQLAPSTVGTYAPSTNLGALDPALSPGERVAAAAFPKAFGQQGAVGAGQLGAIQDSLDTGIGAAAPSGIPGEVGSALTKSTALGDEAATGGKGLLGRIIEGGPASLGSELTGGEGLLTTLKGAGSSALEGLSGVAIPSVVANLAGHFIGGKAGQVVSDTGTGLAAGGALAGGLGAVLGTESLAGPPGWVLAGLTAAGGGLYGLLHNGDDKKTSTHQAYSAGWDKINQYAADLGITDKSVISGAKDTYNATLQAAKDPTDKAVRKQALAVIQQTLSDYKQGQVQQGYDATNQLSAQAYAQQVMAPYLQDNTNAAGLANAAYGHLADTAPDPRTAAIARAAGAGFASAATQNNATAVAGAAVAPFNDAQQQALIAQYQQQIQAAAAAKGQTASL